MSIENLEQQMRDSIARQSRQLDARRQAEQRHRAERESKRKSELEAAAAAREKVAQQQEASLKAVARSAFAGSDVDFERSWPALREVITLQRLEAQRIENQRKFGSQF